MKIRQIALVAGMVALLGFGCEQTAAPAATTVAVDTPGKIAFIRLDSLTQQYTAFAGKQEELEVKAAEAEQAQNERIGAFQKDVQSLQQRANSGRMSPKQIGVEQERLAGREQALMQEAERLRQELQIEQLKLMTEYEENLRAVLDEVQAEFNYDYILSYGGGTGVLMANDKNDITAEIAKRINVLPMDGELNDTAEEEVASEPATEE